MHSVRSCRSSAGTIINGGKASSNPESRPTRCAQPRGTPARLLGCGLQTYKASRKTECKELCLVSSLPCRISRCDARCTFGDRCRGSVDVGHVRPRRTLRNRLRDSNAFRSCEKIENPQNLFLQVVDYHPRIFPIYVSKQFFHSFSGATFGVAPICTQ